MNRLQYLQIRFDQYQREASEEVAKVAKDFQSDLSHAEYRLRWLSGVGKAIYLAQFSLQAQNILEKKPVEETIEVIRDHFLSQIRRWYPERSSSPYSNAMGEERFEALREFVDLMEAV